MKHIAFKNEINKKLNSKIYFKPEPQIQILDLQKYYKIKKIYLTNDCNAQLVSLFIDNLKPPLLCKEVCNFLENNYHQPDEYIYSELLLLISQVMPDLNSETYINNIRTYVG